MTKFFEIGSYSALGVVGHSIVAHGWRETILYFIVAIPFIVGHVVCLIKDAEKRELEK